MKKILIVLVLLFVCSLRVDALGRHGSFSRVGKFPGFSNGAVVLNSSEIFYPGYASDGKNPAETAKIYNIQTKEMTDLKSVMNVYRTNYITTKYDTNHVLISGGYCEGSDVQKLECGKAAEIYNIKENTFTRISNLNFDYNYFHYPDEGPLRLLLSDGRVILYNRNDYGEIFCPKTKTFTKVPKEILKSIYRPNRLFELTSNEILIDEYECSNSKKLFAKIWNLNNNKLTPISLTDKLYKDSINFTAYAIGTPVKISSDTVLFIGAGRYKKEVLKLDINTKKLSWVAKLPVQLAGKAVILPNNQILLYSGELRRPETWPDCFPYPGFPMAGKGIVWAIYDYENNKIYKRRTTSYWNNRYTTSIVNQDNIYFDTGFPKNEKNWILYKYSY